MQRLTRRGHSTSFCFQLVIMLAVAHAALAEEPTLIGRWKLNGDCRDHSGQGNHAINHGVDLETGRFNGQGAYLEVPDAAGANGKISVSREQTIG